MMARRPASIFDNQLRIIGGNGSVEREQSARRLTKILVPINGPKLDLWPRHHTGGFTGSTQGNAIQSTGGYRVFLFQDSSQQQPTAGPRELALDLDHFSTPAEPVPEGLWLP